MFEKIKQTSKRILVLIGLVGLLINPAVQPAFAGNGSWSEGAGHVGG